MTDSTITRVLPTSQAHPVVQVDLVFSVLCVLVGIGLWIDDDSLVGWTSVVETKVRGSRFSGVLRWTGAKVFGRV